MTSYIRVVDYIVLSTLHALLMSSLDDLLCMFKNVPLGYKEPKTAEEEAEVATLDTQPEFEPEPCPKPEP